MKVAITSRGPQLTSQIDPRFGRAKYFVVYDSDTDRFAAHNNDFNVNAVHGAGIQATQDIVDLGVQALITGHVGPKAFESLRTAGVEIYIGAAGTVQEVVEKFKADQLPCAIKADVGRHWS